MIGFILALITVFAIRSTAFRATNRAALLMDIVLLIGLIVLFNSCC